MDADFRAGEGYYLGRGVAQDYKKARESWEKAAAKGHADAQLCLGILYAQGEGVGGDYVKARAWWEKAAAQGNVRALASLGDLYRHGRGIQPDASKALDYYKKAAQAGDAESQYEVGCAYRDGVGAPQDYAAAHDWFEKAAAQGHAKAIAAAAKVAASLKALAELEVLSGSARSKSAADRRQAAERLATFLSNPDSVIRRRAIAALAAMGADAVPASEALQKATADADGEVRKAAKAALEVVSGAAAVAKANKKREELLSLAADLKSREAATRIAALERLTALGSEANLAGEELIEALSDPEPRVRKAASAGLEKVNPKVHPHVMTILGGADPVAGLEGLRKVGPDAAIAVPLVIHLIDHPPLRIPPNGTKLAPVPLGDIYAVLAGIGPKDRRVATIILGAVARRVPRNDAPEPTRVGPGLEVRLRALRQLERIEAGTDEKVKALVAALDDGWGTVEVVHALEVMRKDAAAALPALKKLKDSPSEAVRKAAAQAVEKIGNGEPGR
jgi:TPR repeat protein